MSDPSFLAHLDDAQRDAVLDDSERLLVIAGAGSGKTRVFVNRIARLVTDGAPASSVLALSYTNAAANEVASRLSTMGVTGVQAMTMHAWCHREPMRLFSSVIGRTGYSILDAEGSEDVLRYDMRLGEYGANSAKTALTQAKNLLDDRYAGHTVEEYDRILSSRGQLDFDDLQVGALRILQDSPEALLHYRSSLSHVLVDEYQDINPVQHEILILLCTPQDGVPTPTLTVVGDPDQAIYGFRGADDSFIRGFTDEFSDASRAYLLRNYRSTRRIIALADAIVADNPGRPPKMMTTDNDEGSRIDVVECVDEEAEAESVLSWVQTMIDDGFAHREIAVLYRYHNQLDDVFDLLKDEGLPVWAPYIDDDEQGDRIAVRSVHSAKGLEYDAVALIGWNDGSMPTWRVNRSPELIDEERRVAYVALTRARKVVSVFWPGQRMTKTGSTISQRLSRFLSDEYDSLLRRCAMS